MIRAQRQAEEGSLKWAPLILTVMLIVLLGMSTAPLAADSDYGLAGDIDNGAQTCHPDQANSDGGRQGDACECDKYVGTSGASHSNPGTYFESYATRRS
jgi:hypothetical protein